MIRMCEPFEKKLSETPCEIAVQTSEEDQKENVVYVVDDGVLIELPIMTQSDLDSDW